jgi:RNA methyltransferase, TrmH family
VALSVYKKKLDYSYTFGIYPTIELLQKHPEKVMTVLFSPEKQGTEGMQLIKKLCKKNHINFDTSPHALNKLASKENTLVIGVFNKFHVPMQEKTNHILLVNPSDMGNVGTIIRTMVGFGIKDLGIIRPGVDVFDPRVVRSSMGALFDINFEYFSSFEEYSVRFPKNTVYPFVLNGKKALGEVSFAKPATLIFGNEGEGLAEAFSKMNDTVKIAHSKDIDSLNLAVSVGIALFAFRERSL